MASTRSAHGSFNTMKFYKNRLISIGHCFSTRSRGLRGQFLVSDWLFSLLCLPQTMESSVFRRKNQWFALRTAGHTSPKSATCAWFVGAAANQIGVKTDHLAAAWAFKIVATAMRAEQVALFGGQSDPTSTCLVNSHYVLGGGWEMCNPNV